MRKGHVNPRSWDAAIRAVQKDMLELAAAVPLTDEQDRILTTAFLRCGKLTARKHLAWVATNRELAAKYRISPRTVTNWRREGCPFADGQARVLGWIARRRYAPVGTKAKFAKRLPTLRFKASCADLHAIMQHARELKLEAKLIGRELPPDDWLRRLRCPRQR